MFYKIKFKDFQGPAHVLDTRPGNEVTWCYSSWPKFGYPNKLQLALTCCTTMLRWVTKALPLVNECAQAHYMNPKWIPTDSRDNYTRMPVAKKHTKHMSFCTNSRINEPLFFARSTCHFPLSLRRKPLIRPGAVSNSVIPRNMDNWMIHSENTQVTTMMMIIIMTIFLLLIS